MPQSKDGLSKQRNSPIHDWFMDEHGEFIDLHAQLHTYSEVIDFLKHVEDEYSIKEYSNGNNAGARWLFQIYSREFIQQVADIVENILREIDMDGPILEVMAGDGRLADFLRPLLEREYIATDVKSKRYNIAYPKWIHELDAEDAIAEFNPAIAIMSWEPYLSTKSIEIVDSGIPLMWIGNPGRCGHFDLFDRKHAGLDCAFCVSRHDRIQEEEFVTGIFLFNIDLDSCSSIL